MVYFEYVGDYLIISLDGRVIVRTKQNPPQLSESPDVPSQVIALSDSANVP